MIREKQFYRTFFVLALSLALQNLLTYSVNMMDTLTRESRILSATIREYCVTLSFCAQVAVSFDGYA